jgi:hypothetical protein
MGVSLKTENEAYSGKRMQTRAAKAGGETPPAVPCRIFRGHLPVSPPPASPIATAKHGDVAASLFSFERDSHALGQNSISKS